MSYDVSTSGRSRAAGRLRELVTERRTAHGGWCMISAPFAAEVLSAAGCDWLCVRCGQRWDAGRLRSVRAYAAWERAQGR